MEGPVSSIARWCNISWLCQFQHDIDDLVLMIRIIGIAGLIMTFALAAGAAVITVPGEYATIQDAYLAADSGDTLLVLPGTYHGEGWTEVIFHMKSVKIYSLNGPGETIINGRENRRGWGFRDIENNEMEVVGFSFIDCVGLEMGAVNFHRNSPVTMRDCVIVRGKATRVNPVGEGGGIRCLGSSPTITDCIIQDCEAVQGGGFSLLENSNPVIRRCTIDNNKGSGMMIQVDCSPLIEDSQITFNQASELSFSGGLGIYAQSNATVNRCFIASNRNEYSSGGGIRVEASSPVITNTFIVDNTTIEYAGGVLCRDHAAPDFYFCTITGNMSDGGADGVGSFLFSHPKFYGCIIWHPDWEFYFQEEGILYAEYTDSSVDLTDMGPGNFSIEPGFIGSGNYHLASDSPCIDAGFDYNVYGDYDGESRPFGDGFDVGADEYTTGGEVSMTLSMPAHMFWPGDMCRLTALCLNTGAGRENINLYIVLDVYGEYYFWPSWGFEVDFENLSIPAGGIEKVVIPDFEWPENAGNAEDIIFYGALLSGGTNEILGEIQSWEFGWSDDPTTKPTPTPSLTPTVTPTPSPISTVTPTPTATPTTEPSFTPIVDETRTG